MKNRLILVGGGAFARELHQWALDAARVGFGEPPVGFLDESANAMSKFGVGLEYLGTIENYKPKDGDRLLMAIGDPQKKRRIAEVLRARDAVFATLVHPSAVIAGTATLGEGVVICPNAIVSTHAKIGNLVALNCTAGVGHDVVVGDYCSLSSQVDLMGFVEIEECVFVGSGARILPKVKVKARAKIGAGTVIVRNVAEDAVMYVPPARSL